MSIILSIISIFGMIIGSLAAFSLATSYGAEEITKLVILAGILLSIVLNDISITLFKINFFEFRYYKISFNILLIITILFLIKFIIEEIIIVYEYKKK